LFRRSSFSGFGVPPAKPAAQESGGSQEEEAEGAADGGADDSKSLTTKSHDEEGEGEEDEETTHTTKSKVYKLVKDDSSEDGKPGWKDMGVGEYAWVNSVSHKSFSETLE
jgi:nucleoporin NUP2